MRLTLDRPLLLRGKVVQPDGTGLDRYVLVRNGVIESVSRRRPPLTSDAVYVQAGADDWIFPGLIDLHTHTDYNVLPIWEAKTAPFKNRFQWRNDPSYAKEVKEAQAAIKQNKKALAVFAELQAIAGGTTILQESQPLEHNTSKQVSPVLCRGTAEAADLNLKGDVKILSVVDFFRPDKNGKAQATDKIEAYREARDQNRLQATLAHLAEGRSGFGGDEGCDEYTRAEFETLMAHPVFQDVEAVRSSALAFIHCSGIDPANEAHVRFLRDRGIGVVWSPVSNLLLYQDTLDVQSLVAQGVNVALGSDWSPSGSKHLWEEAKFARFYFDAIGSSVTDGELFGMVTTNAARCLGMNNIGRIEPGCLADFFILRSPVESDTALEVFFKTTDRHVRAVLIGGRPIYGAREFLQRFDLELQSLPPREGTAVADKAVHLPEHLQVNVERDFNALEQTLKGLGQKRNNLLADADTPYRDKINRLRQKVLAYGWQVQVRRRKQQRKRGTAQTPRNVPPDAVVVRRGFRVEDLEPARFRQKLGSLLIPSTVQFQAPLGLTAYLPTVLPDDKPAGVPDAIALLFYASRDAYRDTSKTLGGRAYEELHKPVFSERSKADFPLRLDATLEPDTPYFLFDAAADWQHGTCKVLVGARPDGQDSTDFRAAVLAWLTAERARAEEGLDGAVVCCAADYLIYWEHWNDTALARRSRIKSLARLVNVVLLQNARPVNISAPLDIDFAGIEIVGGECLNLQFQRQLLS
ncbi:MAG TPA: amidohydrolase family protein [Pyrinomonadaceae bacterium]